MPNDLEAAAQLRAVLEKIVHRVIRLLDRIDASLADREDNGDEEPDDTGVADEDALALIERSHAGWFEAGNSLASQLVAARCKVCSDALVDEPLQLAACLGIVENCPHKRADQAQPPPSKP